MASVVQQRDLENAAPPPLSPQEEARITTPADLWTNTRARAIAVGDFNEMSNFRQSSGHNMRLQIAEELYLGWCPKKYWEGTRIPRSSLGVPIAMDQVEALMPPIMGSMFPLRDNVDIMPNPGTSKEEAAATFDVLMSQLDNAQVREKVRIAVKQGLIFGNGILEICWKYQKVQRRRSIARWVPETRNVYDPTTGQSMQVQTGRNRRVVMETMETVEVNLPELKNIPIHDFYIDPNCQTSNIQDARMCAARNYITIGEIKAMPKDYGFQIPADNVLQAMAKGKVTSADDSLKSMGEAYRLGSWAPQNDYTTDPNSWRVEVIRYYTKERCVWIINRMWVLYNAPNSYGFIPFLNAFYVDVPNRFYGYAVTDAVEGEQRFQQAAINAYLDEINLGLNAPFGKTRGAEISGTSMRMYPGKAVNMEKKDDLFRLEFGTGATMSAMAAIEASDRRAQKRTGVSDTAVMGVATQGGDSSGRTATGIGVKAQAAGNRIKYQVENLESNLIEPLLKFTLILNQMFLSPDQIMQIEGPAGQAIQIDPTNIINADVKFRVRGSDKMRSRMALLQAWPLIMQTYLNPSWMQIMADSQNKTIDTVALDRLLSDALQIPPLTLWRDMSPQEKQSMMQAKMAPLMIQQQMQSQKLDAQNQQHDSRDQTDLLKSILAKVPDEAMNDFLGVEPPKQLPSGKSGSTK